MYLQPSSDAFELEKVIADFNTAKCSTVHSSSPAEDAFLNLPSLMLQKNPRTT